MLQSLQLSSLSVPLWLGFLTYPQEVTLESAEAELESRKLALSTVLNFLFYHQVWHLYRLPWLGKLFRIVSIVCRYADKCDSSVTELNQFVLVPQVECGWISRLPDELFHRAYLLLQHHPGQPVPRRPPLQSHVPENRWHRRPATVLQFEPTVAQWWEFEGSWKVSSQPSHLLHLCCRCDGSQYTFGSVGVHKSLKFWKLAPGYIVALNKLFFFFNRNK